MRPFTTLAVLVCLTGPALISDESAAATAQSLVHDVPVRGALFYDRESKREAKVLVPDAKTLRNRHVHDVPNKPGAGILLHSDLAENARHLAKPPSSIWDIAMYVAFDLRRMNKKRVDTAIPKIQQLGPLRIRGEKSDPGEDGAQRIVVKVGPGKLGKRERAAPGQLTGEIEIVRVLDAKRGVLTSFRSVFTGEIFFPKRKNPNQLHRASFKLTDNWKLREVAGNRSVKFKGAVAAAIRKGAEALKKEIAGDFDKKFSPDPERSGQTRKTGEFALILLTLLKAGESPVDPVMKKALDSLRRRQILDSYSLGVAMLAMEACYTPASERDDLLSGRISAPHSRKLSELDEKCMRRWVGQLLHNRTNGRKDTASFHYLASRSFDNSCSQYAILGLYAAHLCGIEIEQEVWVGAARHFLRMQTRQEGRVGLDLLTHAQLEKATPRRTVQSIEAAGWSYTDKYRLPTGSMTTAGIASLTICDSMIKRRRVRDVSARTIQGAIRSGFAWLAKNYDVRNNPGQPGAWRHYYLYGLERACELNQIAYMQGVDWYFDGATLLVDEQGKNGKWGGDTTTCFAILFLKKAALPVITGKR